MKRLALIAALALASCGQDRPAVALPPPALLQCQDEPVAPDLPGRGMQDQRDILMLDYVLALRSAWGDCSSKVAGVKAWADEMGGK